MEHSIRLSVRHFLGSRGPTVSKKRPSNRVSSAMGTPTEHGRNLQAFMQGFFKNTLQPKISSLSRGLKSLERQWSVLPLTLISHDELIDALLRLPTGTRNELSLAIKLHVDQWQLVLQGSIWRRVQKPRIQKNPRVLLETPTHGANRHIVGTS